MQEGLPDRLRVPPTELRRVCVELAAGREPGELQRPATNHIGQRRATDAISFGLQIERDGYNVYVLGRVGSYRHGLAKTLAVEHAKQRPVPDDWCYVNNFRDPERPRTLRFRAGTGAVFRNDMQNLIEEMRLAIPAAFEGDDYRTQLHVIEEETEKEVEAQWQSLQQLAEKQGIAVMQTPTGYVLAPVEKGKVIGDKEFDRLPEARRSEIQESIRQLGKELQERIETMPKLRKKLREQIKALDREITAQAVGLLIADLKKKYEELAEVEEYLDDVQKNIIDNARDFRQTETPSLPFLVRDESGLFGAYKVNLVVDNEELSHAPVVYEPNPSYTNIVGQVEHRAEMGALVTDFGMVRTGALCQANGGYLILDMHRVLGRPFVWEALKQALSAKHVRIESPGEIYGFVSTTTLKPQPIPLDVKIVLVGERWLYYLLDMLDKEFNGLFKIAADLDDDLERNEDSVADLAATIAMRISEFELLPLNGDAIRRVIEECARWADDAERLSTHMQSLDDLLTQADHWARERNSSSIEARDVVEAVEKTRQRHSRMHERAIDAIARDFLLIDTAGSCTGQVNGLSVADLGEVRYGRPVRITATTRIGTGEVVDIEREVELGGAIHSKGMMILSSALSSRYAPEMPLSLHGTVVFEQSYGGVEGDSASVAELCALLSSISAVPIRQNFAVTGSINQLGRVQVVGGVNEKIEGFFDICRRRGLDGSHGVLVPRENVKTLMLRDDVVDAVREGKFNVYAISHIDEAIELLTGVEAGQRGEDGLFPEATVNRKVEDRLIHYANLRKSFAKPENDEGENNESAIG